MTAFLETSIQVLIAERDEYQKAAVRTAVNCKFEYDKLMAERDALAAASYAYASEFALDEEGQPDVGSIHQNIRALKAAGKLALEALECCEAYVGCPAWSPSMLREVQETITALKQAGVQ